MDRNLTMLTDLYQLTMMQGYFTNKQVETQVIFDLFFRKTPDGNGFIVAAGLEQAIDYLSHLQFMEEDLQYLNSLDKFTAEFIEYLRKFRFTGDIQAIPEGTVVFPGEPILRVKASIMEAQLIETALLNIINHQSLIATKAARVKHVVGNDSLLEFGLRRAQGPDAGIYGARAAMIGGCDATSNVLAGKKFDIPVKGTMAHSWIMSFDSELEAFRAYAKQFPHDCILLVDTYDTIASGVPNAIQVFQEMKQAGVTSKLYGIRLDSGDLAYLSVEARKLLDDAGMQDAAISASSDLDENIIQSLKVQGAQITVWGVGTKLITSASHPALGGVYKLAAEIGQDGEMVPKIKLSNNIEKITNPGIKKVVRIYDVAHDKIKADLITLSHEKVDPTKPLTLTSELEPWKRMELKAGKYYTKEMLLPIMQSGKLVYEFPSIVQIKQHLEEELQTLWPQYRRILNPHVMPVDLSDKLYHLKRQLIGQIKQKIQ